MAVKLIKRAQVAALDYDGKEERLGSGISDTLSANTEFVYFRVKKGNGNARDIGTRIRKALEELCQNREQIVAAYTAWQKAEWARISEGAKR